MGNIIEYYSTNRDVSQRYDFDKDSLIFAKGKDLNNLEAGFIGGEYFLDRYLYDVFNFDQTFKKIQSKIGLQSCEATYKFTVDEKGRVKEIRKIQNTITNPKLKKRLILTLQSLDNQWYPAKIDGITQSTEKTISFKVLVNSQSKFNASSEYMSVLTVKKFDIKITVQ
jgi:hypothetical protein